MCFDRNINEDRDVKFLECDYLLVQQSMKLTLEKICKLVTWKIQMRLQKSLDLIGDGFSVGRINKYR